MGKPGKKRDRLVAVHSAESIDCSVGLLPDRTPEQAFSDQVSLARRRQLGQFFTPPDIAQLMCRWLRSRDTTRDTTSPALEYLDPAVGPGIFVRTLLEEEPDCRITAIDIDPLVIQTFERSVTDGDSVEIIATDFLTWPSERKFDAIVANPPYLRHHDLNYAGDIFRAIGERNQVAVSRLTNAYALFILEICRRLRKGGRAAIITPGEWLNANFGHSIKAYLLEHQLLANLIYFSHAATVFDGALTTACILLIEKQEASAKSFSVHTHYVRPKAAVAAVEKALQSTSSQRDVVSRELTSRILLQHAKWDALLELGPSSVPKGFVPLRELASSCRGIATGANSFFHISQRAWEEAGVSSNYAKPCIGRATDASGLIFDRRDFSKLVEREQRTHLLQFEEPLSSSDRKYLREGVAQGLPSRYLLAVRSPWYRMEQRAAAPIWAAVFGRSQLRFIWNASGVLNLTTFHCIYPCRRDRVFVQALVACLNSRIIQKLARRHQRVYGGGLIKFEPRDLLEIEVPNLLAASNQALRELAACLKALDAAARKRRELAEVHARLDEIVRSMG